MKAKRLLAVLSAVMMIAGTIPGSTFAAAAVNEDPEAIAEVGAGLWEYSYPSNFGYTVQDTAYLPEEPAQEKFDLRDVDGKRYVPSVKNQGVFGTCWAFAATAAAEVSMVYEAGVDLNTVDADAEFDFSERHLAWFTSTPQPADGSYPAQAGEGYLRYTAEQERQSGDPNIQRLNEAIFSGAFSVLATTLYSSLQGPAPESLAPYLSNDQMICDVTFCDVIRDPAELEEYKIDDFIDPETKVIYHCETRAEFLEAIKKEETMGQVSRYANTGWYKGEGRYWFFKIDADAVQSLDWSVDESLRYVGQELESSAILPAICIADEDTKEYRFSTVGLNAIKNELLNGRAVVMGFCADTSMPGEQVKEDGFINFIDENGQRTDKIDNAKYWCHYTYDTEYDPDDPDSVNRTVPSNHAVTIVGYDDTFPKEYFNDPKGNLKYDGAFIVKNSWGTAEDYIPWGNDGDGYFYVSYFDQSIDDLETFDFSFITNEQAAEKKATALFPYIHDLMPSEDFGMIELPDSAMSNVFTADCDLRLYATSYISASPGETVKYDVYLLDDGYTDPTDGTLAATKTESYQYAGYHRVTLDEPIYIPEGQSFSIVVTATCEDGVNSVSFKQGWNILSAERQVAQQREDYINEHGSDEGFYPKRVTYVKGVVNKGESFVYLGGEWFDWADVTEASKTCGIGDSAMIDYDNFTIQAFTDSEIMNVKHTIDDPSDEPYDPGDEVPCTVTLTGAPEYGFTYDVYVNGTLIGTVETEDFIDGIAEIPYIYTVKDADAERGYFENTVSVFITHAGIYRELELFEEFSDITVKADVEEAQDDSSDSVPEDSSKPDESSKPDDSSKPQDQSQGSNPGTGTAFAFTGIALAAAAFVASKKRA